MFGRKKGNNKGGLAQSARVVMKTIKYTAAATRAVVSFLMSFGWPLLILVLIVVVVAVGASAVADLGNKITQLAGISKSDISFIKNVDKKTLKEIRSKTSDDVYAAFDCSNYAPDQRKPGVNCIPGLLAEMEGQNQGPVPTRAEYMVPVWQAAGARYNIPWMVLAAINGARSDFNWVNCQTAHGDGPYRIEDDAWQKYAVNGGSTPMVKDGLKCYKTKPSVIAGAQPNDDPSAYQNKDSASADSHDDKNNKGGQGNKNQQILGPPSPNSVGGSKVQIYDQKPLKKLSDGGVAQPKGANIYDPVDAAFTQAKMLASNGAFKAKNWNYSGSASNNCTTGTGDGRIWYVPEQGGGGAGAGAMDGYNSHLNIPQWAVQLAARWRSNTGNLQPRRADTPLDAKLKPVAMPKKDVAKLLTVAWEAFGVKGEQVKSNVAANLNVTWGEVGDRPYLGQSVNLNDVNNTPTGYARGMVGFIPPTFAFWHVDGFNDIYNPLDSILAFVNAQVNGMHYVLDHSGWGTPETHNPYTTGGSSVVANGSDANPIKKHPYKGKPQTDRVSKAVAYQDPSDQASACYVAVVHDWYDAIKKNPPSGAMAGGDIRARIVQIAEQELAKNVSETNGDNVPRYHYPGHQGEIAPYSISNFWCMAFASWVWYQAGLQKQMLAVGGMTDHAGLALPSLVSAMQTWGEGNGLGHAANSGYQPQPGDMGLEGGDHVELVEKVSPSGQVISFIGGNTSDAVSRDTSFESSVTYWVSPPDVAPTSGGGGAGGQLSSSFSNLESKLNAKAGIAVSPMNSTSAPQVYGDLTQGHSWSSLKPVIVTALSRQQDLNSSEQGWATTAITASDNTGAAKLFDVLENTDGGLSGASKTLEKTLQAAGDTDTTVPTAPPPAGAVSTWGQTEWSLADATKFYRALGAGKLMNDSKTNYLLGLMGNVISSQQWGLGSVSWGGNTTVAFKAGWGPDTDQGGKYLVRQSGIIRTGHGALVVTMAAVPNSGSFDDGTTDLNQIAGWVNDNFDDLLSGDSGGGGDGSGPDIKATGQDAKLVQAAADKYSVPFWILWGIAGAESGWGSGGSNLFGLLSASGGVDVSDWQAASMQSAKTMASLKNKYGSWEAALDHYTDYGYNLDYVKQLAEQQAGNI